MEVFVKGRFLIGSNEKPAEKNIYSGKSALILDWLLRQGIKSQDLSLRNVNDVIISYETY